jgi:hypothetical protein
MYVEIDSPPLFPQKRFAFLGKERRKRIFIAYFLLRFLIG